MILVEFYMFEPRDFFRLKFLSKRVFYFNTKADLNSGHRFHFSSDNYFSMNASIDLKLTQFRLMGSSYGVMANVLNFTLEISEFEHQSCSFIHFWTNIIWKITNLLTSRCSSTNVLWHLIIHEDWYAKKESKPKPNNFRLYIYIYNVDDNMYMLPYPRRVELSSKSRCH